MKNYINIDTDGFFDMKDFDGEYWKDLSGFEEYYMASNYGRIKRKHRKWYSGRQMATVKEIEEGIVAQRRLKGGYIKATLCQNGVKKSYSVHVLMAKTFIENPNNLPVVNHKDLNKDNNCVENLEWVTYSENTKHWLDNSGYEFDTRRNTKKLTEEQVKSISEYYFCHKNLTTREIANKFGVTYHQARNVIKKSKATNRC